MNWKIPFMVVMILFSAVVGKYYSPNEGTPLSVETQVSAQSEEAGSDRPRLMTREMIEEEAAAIARGEVDFDVPQGSAQVFFPQSEAVIREMTALKSAPDGVKGRSLGVGEKVQVGGSVQSRRGDDYYWVQFLNTADQMEYGFLPDAAVIVLTGRVPVLTYDSEDAAGWLNPTLTTEEGETRQVVVSTDQGDPVVLAQTVGRADAVSIAWLPESVRQHADRIGAIAAIKGVDPNLVAILVTVESGGSPTARSSAGASGLMQLMPGTAGDMARANNLQGFDPAQMNVPETNLLLGTSYIALMLKLFGSVEMAAAAYNGGPGHVGQHLKTGQPLFRETANYQRWVGGMWRERHDATSPTYQAWLAAGGQRLVDVATAQMGQQVSMVR